MTEPLSPPHNPLVPAFRVRGPGACVVLMFRCPWCSHVHEHGPGHGGPVQWRGADQCVPPAEISGRNYRLLVCGEVASPRMLPRITCDDVAALNLKIAEQSARRGAAAARAPVAGGETLTGDILHLLAYAYTDPEDQERVPRLIAWCPWCRRQHWHGDTGDQLEVRVGAGHCGAAQDSPAAGSYQLVRVCRINDPRRIPQFTVDETLALSCLLARATADARL